MRQPQPVPGHERLLQKSATLGSRQTLCSTWSQSMETMPYLSCLQGRRRFEEMWGMLRISNFAYLLLRTHEHLIEI